MNVLCIVTGVYVWQYIYIITQLAQPGRCAGAKREFHVQTRAAKSLIYDTPPPTAFTTARCSNWHSNIIYECVRHFSRLRKNRIYAFYCTREKKLPYLCRFSEPLNTCEKSRRCGGGDDTDDGILLHASLLNVYATLGHLV